MQARYPRDMYGYGQTPPNAAWPGGAKIAVQIVVNYEEGGENCILHGDEASEAFLSEIVGAAQWPGQRHWNMESIYEYGARAGFWRLHRMLADMPVTVYGVATALARSPHQVAAMKDAGWEIASHGLKWIEYKDYAPEDERADMEEAIRLHTEVVGERPRGWYTGRCSVNTVRLAAEEGGFDYVADTYTDDLPYWSRFGERNQLIVPYTLDTNDMRFATPQGFNSGDQFETYLRDSFDVLYAEGAAGAPKMLSIGLHCRLVGRPGRAAALKRAIDHMAAHEGVWFATRAEIAAHWARMHPPVDIERPSEMDVGRFTHVFGDIFEHSTWVAEAAYRLELGPAHDTPLGLHALLCRAFRAAPEAQRLEALRAYPDHAATQNLAAASSAEQASAGHNTMTGKEQDTFTTLTMNYVNRFGFPFIIAARDHDKASLLAALERRLSNDPDSEFAEACQQVERIAELRVHEKMNA